MRQKTQSCFIRDSDSSPHTEVARASVLKDLKDLTFSALLFCYFYYETNKGASDNIFDIDLNSSVGIATACGLYGQGILSGVWFRGA
jgi:hypothetical protein